MLHHSTIFILLFSSRIVTCVSLACVQTSPFSFVARGKGPFSACNKGNRRRLYAGNKGNRRRLHAGKRFSIAYCFFVGFFQRLVILGAD